MRLALARPTRVLSGPRGKCAPGKFGGPGGVPSLKILGKVCCQVEHAPRGGRGKGEERRERGRERGAREGFFECIPYTFIYLYIPSYTSKYFQILQNTFIYFHIPTYTPKSPIFERGPTSNTQIVITRAPEHPRGSESDT